MCVARPGRRGSSPGCPDSDSAESDTANVPDVSGPFVPTRFLPSPTGLTREGPCPPQKNKEAGPPGQRIRTDFLLSHHVSTEMGRRSVLVPPLPDVSGQGPSRTYLRTYLRTENHEKGFAFEPLMSGVDPHKL